MKNLLKSSLTIVCIAFLSANSYAQEQEIEFDTAATSANCLSECRHFISTNVLQIATGTINLDYECHVVPQFSVKLGTGTILGTRILFNESQQPCIAGGFYGLVEPRFYFKKASEACLLQYGLGISYKYWNFTAENRYKTMSEFKTETNTMTNEEREAALQAYKDNDDYNVTDDAIYLKENQVEHLGGISAFGKACVAGGLTVEMELGIGLGTKAKEFYFTPNLGFSFGWSFGHMNKKAE